MATSSGRHGPHRGGPARLLCLDPQTDYIIPCVDRVNERARHVDMPGRVVVRR